MGGGGGLNNGVVVLLRLCVYISRNVLDDTIVTEAKRKRRKISFLFVLDKGQNL